MIHDPTIEVTCDACGNSVKINSLLIMPGEREAVAYRLELLEWILKDGKQFCCERCAENE